MMINSVRDTVHDFLEKNNRGWLKPERFNNYAYLAQIEILESYFYDYNRWLLLQTNKNSGTSLYSNIPKNIKEKLDIFHKIGDLTHDGTKFVPPSDSYRILDVYYNGDFVDEISQRRLLMLNKSNLTLPSVDYSVYVRTTEGILVYPTSIITGVSASYIRTPLSPKWTYNVVLGNPQFNQSASDFQDFEIHPSDEPRIVVKILSFAGVSIRESEIVQYAELKESQKKQNESRL